MKKIVICLALLLSACSENVPVVYLQAALDSCQSNRGVSYIVVNSNYVPQYVITAAHCRDGAVFYLDVRKQEDVPE